MMKDEYKISVLHSKAIDPIKWDACIHRSRYSTPYSLWGYINSLHIKFDAMVLGDYEAIALLPYHRKRIIKSLYTPFFIQQMGWISPQELSRDYWAYLINYIQSNYSYYHYALNENLPLEFRELLTPKTNIILPLNQPIETLRYNFSNHHRRNIAKAKGHGLCIEPSTDANEFMDKLLEIYQPHIYPKKHLNIIGGNLVRTLVSHGIGQLLIAKSTTGEWLAGLFYIKTKDRLILLFPVSTEAGKQKLAMYAIIDYLISTYSGGEFLLDFEGSSQKGIADFYLGFNGQKQDFAILCADSKILF